MTAEVESWRVAALDAQTLCKEIRDLLNSYIAYREDTATSDVVITLKVVCVPNGR